MEYEIFDKSGIKLCISKEHRFGTDSLLLGEFARSAKNKTAADLCSGCGIIPIMLCDARKIYAVEIQEEAAELLRRTVCENKLDNIVVVCEDLRNTSIERESLDLVTANPPYFVLDSGFERECESAKVARYESECTLDDVVKTAGYLLKYGGDLKMCMTASRLAECIGIMQSYKIEPKEVVLIGKGNPPDERYTDGGSAARLFLISGKKGAKSGVKITWK
jgi:tRNA1(Val) A37 N6-methylase TrmN6